MKQTASALIAAFLMACIALLFFCSCSTIHKLKQTDYKKLDSATSVAKTSTIVNDSNSDDSLKSFSDFQQIITLNFDTSSKAENQQLSTVDVGDTSATWSIQSAIDYLEGPKKKTVKKQAESVIINGIPIISNRPLSSIIITSKGHDSIIQISSFNKHDSSTNGIISNTHVISSDKSSNKTKSSTGFGIWFYIIGGLAITGTVLYLYNSGWIRILAFWKRKNQQNKNNTT